MNDNQPTFSSLSLFKNSMKKIARKETKQHILNNDMQSINKSKALLLKKADLNVQNVLSTILINCDDEEKNNYNINGTLKQIQNVKRNIPVYNSSSSADDSDLTPGTRKNVPTSINQMIGSPNNYLKNLRMGRMNQTAKSLNKQINDYNNANHSKKVSNDNLTELTNSKLIFDKGKIRKVGSFLYKQNENQKGNEDSDEEGVGGVGGNNNKNGIFLNSNSIRNLNRIKEDIYDNINLSPMKTKSTKKDVSLHKTEYAEDKQSKPNNSSDDDDDGDNTNKDDNKGSFSPLALAADSQFRSNITIDSPFRCFLKKTNLVYDSLSEEEESQDEYYYFEPNHCFIFLFDTVLAILSLLSFFHLPFAIAFIHNSSRIVLFFNFIFNTIIDFLYFIDIIIAFFTAYYDLEEHFIFKNNDIFFHYLEGWFVLDLIATIPFNFLLDFILMFYPDNKLTKSTLAIYSNDILTLVHLFRLLRLLKCFKIIFKNSFLRYLQSEVFDSMIESKWALINISLLLFFASVNFFGCIFVFLGYNNYPNWFEKKNLEPYDSIGIYVTSIYFILMTIVSIGYGDICAANMIERIFNVFLLIFGIMLYSWAISAISNQIEDTSIKATEYHHKLKLLEQIKLSHKGFPHLLNEKIKRYLFHNYEHEQCNVENILNQLPWILRNALIYNMYRPILENFIFFKNFNNDDFCVRVLMAFKPIVYMKNERIIHDGDYLEEMIFVKKGILSLELLIPSVLNEELEKTLSLTQALTSTINPFEFESKKILSVFSMKNNVKLIKDKDKDKPKQISTGYEEKYVKLIYLRRNEHFGDIMMFLNQRCPLSVRVKTKKAEVYLLKKTDAIDISMNFPKIWRTIIRKSIFNFEQINCLIRKTLRFFFIQNQACFNQLMKKYNNFPKIMNAAPQFFNGNNPYNVPNDNCELASIPTMNSDQSFTTQRPNNNNEVKITGMMKTEDEACNMKFTESSTANLITHTNEEQQNENIVKSKSKSKSNKNEIQKTLTLFNDNCSRKSNQNKLNSSFKQASLQAEDTKSAQFMNEKSEESIQFDFSVSHTLRKDELAYKRSFETQKKEEINNELYDNESIYSATKYGENPIVWDNFSDKKIITDLFTQKPDNDIMNLFKSIPEFRPLTIDKGEKYEYNPNTNIVYYTSIPDPGDDSSLNMNPFKIAINVISTHIEDKKEHVTVPIADKNILKWDNIINGTSKEDKTNCQSSRSNKSARSERSMVSNRSPRTNRSGKSDKANSNELGTASKQDHLENEGLDRIITAKHKTVNIFRKKTKRGTIKEPLKSKRGFEPQSVNTNSNNNGNSLLRSNTSLLQVIGENIHSNSMNLNNPASFYSSTFANMIDMHKTKGDLLQINKRMNNLLLLCKDNE